MNVPVYKGKNEYIMIGLLSGYAEDVLSFPFQKIRGALTELLLIAFREIRR